MKISCPSCSTSYTVPDDSLGAAGRKVKCDKCDHTWLATGEYAEVTSEVTPSVVEPEEEVITDDDLDAAEAEAGPLKDSQKEPPKPDTKPGKTARRYWRESSPVQKKGYKLAGVFIVLTMIIMAMMYISGSLIHSPNAAYFEVRNVKAEINISQDGIRVLDIGGRLYNSDVESQRDVPDLRVYLDDDNHSHFDIVTDEKVLAAGRMLDFKASYPGLPDTVETIRIEIISEAE